MNLNIRPAAAPLPRRRAHPVLSALALREAANKLEVYWRVRAPRLPAPMPRERWGELVDAACAGGPYGALFRLERLGRCLAGEAWRVEGGRPRGLFAHPGRPPLPARGLIPLHVGMGLAFADALLGPQPRRVDAGELGRLLARLVACCRDNSRPGYTAPAWEALGVYVQLFRPRWVALAGELLGDLDRDAAGCFWHGAGRGTYFLPFHLLPGSTARALALCRQQPADEEGRADALSGFVFAAAMVNLRHPRVLEAVLDEAAACARTTALVPRAVAASVLVRREVTPHDPAIPRLLSHQAARPERWRRWVTEPALRALADEAPLRLASRQLTGVARHPPRALPDPRRPSSAAFGNIAAACAPSAVSAATPSRRPTTRW